MSSSPMEQIRQAELAASETVAAATREAAGILAQAEKDAARLRMETIDAGHEQARARVAQARADAATGLTGALTGLEEELRAHAAAALARQPGVIDTILAHLTR